MASKNLKGITIEIGGNTSNLTTALRDVDGELSNIQSNLRTVESALRLDPGNVDALAERQRLLNDAVATTTERLETLREAQRQADQQIANGVEVDEQAYQSLRAEIIRAEASLNNYTSEINEAVTETDRLTQTISQQEADLADLRDEYTEAVLTHGRYSREARDLSDQIDDLSDELNTNRTRLEGAQHAAEDAGDAANESSSDWTILKGTIADLASKAIQNALSSLQNLAGTLWNLGDDTREFRTNMGKVETAFETAGFSASDAREAYEDFYGILADDGQATEAISHLAELTDSQKELDEWTTIATGVYAKFGDSLPIENLTEAANETAKTAQLTGGLADALNWAGVNEEDFQKKLEACNDEAERETLIRETLTGLYSEAAKSYAETNGQIIEANEAQANYNSALAGLGEIIEPIKTAFVNGMTLMFDALKTMLEGVDIEAVKALITSAFDYLTTTVFPAIQSGIQWFIENKDIVIAALAGIVAGIAAFKVVSIIQTAVGAFKAFQAATSGATLAQQALNLVMSMNPVGIVVAAIAGLVTAFILLWKNCDEFREFWINLWEIIKNAAATAWESISSFFSAAWETIKAVWDTVQPYFSAIWETIKAVFAVVVEYFSTLFSDAWAGIQTAWAAVTEWFSGLWESIKNIFFICVEWFSQLFTNAWTGIQTAWAAVTTWFATLWANIQLVFQNCVAWFTQIFTDAWAGAQAIWDTVSGYFSTLWANIQAAFADTVTWFSKLFSDAWAAITAIWDLVVQYFTDLWENIKLAFADTVEWWSTLFSDAWKAITAVWDTVSTYFSDLWDNITGTFSTIGTTLEGYFKNAWDLITGVFAGWGEFFSGLWESITSTFSNIGTNLSTAIGDSVKSGINSILGWVESTVNSAIGLINGAIDIINKVPGVDVSHVKAVSIPKLASGGVAREPMLAEIGEYAGASRNPEIVTPQDILRDTFEESLARFAENGFNSDSGQDFKLLNMSIAELFDLIAEYLPGIAKNSNKGIYIDKRRLVAELAPDIDDALGEIADRKGRGAV